MNDTFWENFVTFTGSSPIFKGGSVLLCGLLALFFAYWMRKKWGEAWSAGFMVFIAVAVFVVFFGAFILVFQPQWWKLPY